MFGFLKKYFFYSNDIFSCNVLNVTPLKYVSMNNQKCRI